MSTRNSQTDTRSHLQIADRRIVFVGRIIITRIIVSVGISPSELAEWAT
jgi:hypothetical protein